MTDNIEIGFRIKKAREDKDYTQEDIARELGMNKSTIQRYENGGVEKIKLPVIDAMARFLGVSPAWLLGKTNDPTDEDKAYFSVMKSAREDGFSPEDIEFALDFLRRARKRDEEAE